MEIVKQYKKEIILKSFFVFLPILFFLIIFNKSNWLYGFILGYLSSVLNFHLMSVDIGKLSILQARKFQSLLILRFFMRYLIMGLVIFCGFLYNLNIFMLMIGLFFVQIVIFIDNLLGVKRTT